MTDVLELEPRPKTVDGGPTDSVAPSDEPLSSLHTSNFPDILRQLNISLAVSTYQANRLVLLRPEGDLLNTAYALENAAGFVAKPGKWW